MSTYGDLLKDPRWKRRRLEILERDCHACRECGFAQSLQVHHRWYEFGRQPWDYESDALITLCRPCHEGVTVSTKRLKFASRWLSAHEISLAADFVQSLPKSRPPAREPFPLEMWTIMDPDGTKWDVSPWEKCDQHGVRQYLCWDTGGHPTVIGVEANVE